MRRVRAVLVSASVLAAFAALGLAPYATGTVAHHPRLVLKSAAPLTVSGRQFRAHERVRLVLHQPSGTTQRRARAGAHGAFRKLFTGVSAKGSAGSRATLVRRALTQCPPA